MPWGNSHGVNSLQSSSPRQGWDLECNMYQAISCPGMAVSHKSYVSSQLLIDCKCLFCIHICVCCECAEEVIQWHKDLSGVGVQNPSYVTEQYPFNFGISLDLDHVMMLMLLMDGNGFCSPIGRKQWSQILIDLVYAGHFFIPITLHFSSHSSYLPLSSGPVYTEVGHRLQLC